MPDETRTLTARQRKFMTICATDEGYDPVYPPFRAPALRNDELKPLTDARLVAYSEAVEVWTITPAGRRALARATGQPT